MDIDYQQEKKKFFSNTLEMRRIERYEPDFNKVLNLYNLSFPKNELMNFNVFYTSHLKGDVIAFYDNNKFIGFAALLSNDNISNILYFAIEPTLRGKGYGTQALKQICQYFNKNKIILDVEDAFECNNEREREKRLKRILFYTRVGFKLTNIRYNWNGEYYVIMMINSDNLPEKDFWDFWKSRK